MHDHAARGLDHTSHSLRIVELRPLVLLALHLISDQLPGNHPVRQPIPRIARDDVHLVIPLVLADIRHVIHRIKDLPTPPVVHAPGLGKPLPRPLLQLPEPRRRVLLPDLVVAPANNHVVVLVIALGQPHVLVGLGVVVEQAVLDAALGHANGDAVGAVELELDDDAEFLEGHAGGFDGVLGLDGVPGFGLDLDGFVAEAEDFDAFFRDGHDARVGVALEVGLFLEPGKDAGEVAGWVEGGLVADDHAAALVDLAGPAADFEVFLRGSASMTQEKADKNSHQT